MKKYKTKLNRAQVETILALLLNWLQISDSVSVYEKMHCALLSEVATEMSKQIADPFKKDFKINWKAAQALAMQIFFFRNIGVTVPYESYICSTLIRISNEIEQQFI